MCLNLIHLFIHNACHYEMREKYGFEFAAFICISSASIPSSLVSSVGREAVSQAECPWFKSRLRKWIFHFSTTTRERLNYYPIFSLKINTHACQYNTWCIFKWFLFTGFHIFFHPFTWMNKSHKMFWRKSFLIQIQCE